MQESLLKLIEGCTISVPVSDRRKHPQGNNVQCDTSNVLFICGGAFERLFDTEKRAVAGFNAEQPKIENDDEKANEKLTSEALKKYGIMPELIGRLHIKCALTGLTENDLVRVLTEPEDAITKEYQMLLEKDGVALVYEPDALHKIAKLAIEKQIGARGLRAIIEDVLLDIMYEIPDMKNVCKCIITNESIESKQPKIIKKRQKKNAAATSDKVSSGMC